MLRNILRSVVALLLLLLMGCGGVEQAAETSPAASPENTATAASSTESTPAPAKTTRPGPPTPGPGEFINPVIDRDFPDPDALKVGDTYYAYSTNTPNVNIQMARSTDLVEWEYRGDALPRLPGWARSNALLTWAPEVTTSADGSTYLMYFTARDNASDKQCIGVATSDAPDGQFVSDTEEPIICQPELGGSIDAGSFVDDDGSRYLLWKNDGNCCGKPTWLYIQQVSADGLTLEGEPTQLIRNDKAWEGHLVEAPTMWKHEGKYFLFYSANAYDQFTYAVGVAVADSLMGPYTKPANEPILKTDMQNQEAFGPGGQDIVVDDDGDTWMLYHTWNPTHSYRAMQIDELVWEDGVPVVLGPDKVPQAVP